MCLIELCTSKILKVTGLRNELKTSTSCLEELKMQLETFMGVKTPIVALTGNALQSDRELFFEAGVDDFQTKVLVSPINWFYGFKTHIFYDSGPQ